MRLRNIVITCLVYVVAPRVLGSNPDPVCPGPICPPSDMIAPCTCNGDCNPLGGPVVDCRNISDQELLSKVLYEAGEYQYEEFHLWDSHVMYLPDTLFGARRLRSLNVFSSSLVSLVNRKPGVQPPLLSEIRLQDVDLLGSARWDMLSGFPNLTRLSHLRVSVSKIDESFSRFVSASMEDLTFEECRTKKIHDRAFASLPNLQFLVIKSNKVKELKRSMFPTPSKLLQMDFNGNQLSSLPEDLFSQMPDLKHVYFRNNLLKDIPENTFGTVFQSLESLDLENNPLKCRCSIAWIYSTGKLPNYFRGTCQEPKNMAGKYVEELVAQDFQHC